MERLLPLCARMSTEDDLPGQYFALIEEILMALSLFSEGMLADDGAKLNILIT